MQAQELAEVKWSLAERLGGAPTATEVERAFADGEILRTHVMRPTWHFVAAEDVRWLLRLTAPRVHQALRYWYRKLGLDGTTLARAHRAFARELAGGEPRTRKELVAGLGIEGDSISLGHLFGHAEVEQLIVSGPPRGKQQTYVLFDDRVPPDPGPSGDAALAELVRRYFQSHGPATARDFAWWSGLTLTQARAAIGLCEEIERTLGDDETPWFTLGPAPEARARSRCLLLPTYDELIVAYKDLRVDLVREPPREGLLTRTISIDGRTVGGWKRTLSKHTVTVEATVFKPLGREERSELAKAVARFAAHLELEGELALARP